MNATSPKRILISILFLMGIFVAIAAMLNQNRIIENMLSRPSVMVKEEKKIERISLDLTPLNNSGISGKAELKENQEGKTRVTITLNNPIESTMPAYIHNGNCQNLTTLTDVLSTIRNGLSETIINKPLNQLVDKETSIVVHKSLSEITKFVSCAELKSP